jgi:hypothetical protein
VHFDDWISRGPELLKDLESGLPVQAEPWRNYELLSWPNALNAVERLLKSLVLNGPGIALLRCGSSITASQARLLQLIIGSRFGTNVTITATHDGRQLFAICESEDATAGGRFAGNGLNNLQIGFHTDGSGSIDRVVEFVSMLCIHPAEFGGESRIANAQLAYGMLPERDRSMLRESFPRQDPYHPDQVVSMMNHTPIFGSQSKCGSYSAFSYHPMFIRRGILAGQRKIPKEIEATLGSLEKALEMCSFEFKLRANDILLINNYALAHDRRRFVNKSGSPRLLERFWAGAYRTIKLARVGT